MKTKDQYIEHTLYLFFSNIAVDADENEVTPKEAINIILSMDKDSNDYGKLEPQELYQDVVSSYLWGMIVETAMWFKLTNPTVRD